MSNQQMQILTSPPSHNQVILIQKQQQNAQQHQDPVQQQNLQHYLVNMQVPEPSNDTAAHSSLSSVNKALVI